MFTTIMRTICDKPIAAAALIGILTAAVCGAVIYGKADSLQSFS